MRLRRSAGSRVHRDGKLYKESAGVNKITEVKPVTDEPTDLAPMPDGWDRESMVNEKRSDPDLGWVITHKFANVDAPFPDDLRSQSGTIKTLVAQWPQLVLQDDVLCRAWVDAATGQIKRYQLVPPPSPRVMLNKLAHEGLTGGLLGFRRNLSSTPTASVLARLEGRYHSTIKTLCGLRTIQSDKTSLARRIKI